MFDVYVMVDYSAASTGGPTGGGRNGLWLAMAGPGLFETIQPFRTRSGLWTDLARRLTSLADAGLRVLCGLDFAFGYPAGTAAALGAPASTVPWQQTWGLLRRQISDDTDNVNNRFAVAAALNRRIDATAGPFWGVPRRQRLTGLSSTKPTYPVDTVHQTLAEFRHTETSHHLVGARPKSVWQLLGAGAVGGQTLVGIPRLARLVATTGLAGRCHVWPFHTGVIATGGVVFAEVYPSLLPDDVTTHTIKDARQVLALARAYRQLDRQGSLRRLFALPAMNPDRLSEVTGEEGWILLVR